MSDTKHSSISKLSKHDTSIGLTGTEQKNDSQLFDEYFHLAIDNASFGIILFKPIYQHNEIIDFIVEYINPTSSKFSGADPYEYIGKTLFELSPDTKIFEEYKRVFLKNERYETEKYYEFASLKGWFNINAYRVRDRLVVSTQNISHAKEALDGLVEDNNTMKSILERMTDGYIEMNEGNEITYINKKAEELMNRTNESLVGKNIWVEFPFMKRTLSYKMYKKAIETQRDIKYEEYLETLGRWFEVQIYPYGRASSVYINDTTDRKLYEERFGRLAAIIESSNDAIIGKTLHGIITDWNPSAERLYQYKAEEVIGQNIEIIFPDELRYELDVILKNLKKGKNIRAYETKRKKKDGTIFDVSISISPIFDSSHNVVGASTIVRDITGKKRSEDLLKNSEEKFRKSVINAPIPIIIHSDEGQIIHLSKGFIDITGYRKKDIPTVVDLAKKTFGDNELAIKQYIDFLRDPEGGELSIKTKTGDERIWEFSSSFVDTTPAGNSLVITTANDITDRKKSEEKFYNLAYYDQLTGLPNRANFNELLEKQFIKSRKQGLKFAIIFIDIDNFKNINDTLGHNVGDNLLKEVATRLRDCIRLKDIVARQGGDEFTFIIPDIGSKKELEAVAQKIIKKLSVPFKFRSREISFSPSIGISIFPYDSDRPERLVMFADFAMYMAKRGGGNRYAFYNIEFFKKSLEKISLEGTLRHAFKYNDFKIVYQKKNTIDTNKTVGLEALLRLDNYDSKKISIPEIINFAEESGMIISLGEWVLRTVCKEVRKNEVVYNSNVRISINVSPKQINLQFVKLVKKVLKDYDIDPKKLEFEITETAALQNFDLTKKILTDLSKMGISISVDDFGIGYSSLSYLYRLPVDKIKIDQSFIRNIDTNKNDSQIVNAIISMAHNLELQVVAEGVEKESQIKLLQSYHCDEVQGYILNKPTALSKLILD